MEYVYRKDELMAIPKAHHSFVVIAIEVDAFEAKLVHCTPHVLVHLDEDGRAEFVGFERRVIVGVYSRAACQTDSFVEQAARTGRQMEWKEGVLKLTGWLRWVARQLRHSRPPIYVFLSYTSTSTSKPYLSLAFAIQNAAEDPAAPAPMMAMRLGMVCISGTPASLAMSGTWDEALEKKGSLKGSWNAYAGKKAAVATRNTTGDFILKPRKMDT